MTTFTTTIDAMYTLQKPGPNYVVTVLWTVTGVDGEHTASISGNIQFDPNQAPDDYIPYDQLTEAIVLGWIPPAHIEGAQMCVQGQIDSMITPPASPENTPFPWGN